VKKISRFAAGLNKLFDAIGLEATPNELAEHVQPTVDVTQFYGQSTIRDVSSVNGALAVDGAITITVPDNETWLLYHISGQFTTAGALSFVALTLNVDGVPIAWDSFAGAASFVSSPRQVVLGHQFPYPRLLRPGRSVRLTLSDLGGVAALACQLNVCYGQLA